MGLEAYFVDLATLATLVVLITEFLTNKLLNLSGFAAQATSWVVAEVVIFVGYFAGFSGVLDNVESLVLVAGYGLALGLVSNGIFSVPVVQSILEFVRLRLAPPTDTNG